MRLSKTARTFLISGILIVLIVSLFMAYLQQGQEQSRLSQELSAVQLLLSRQSASSSLQELSSQQRELESQLAQVELQVDTAKTNLSPVNIKSIEVTDTLFEVAEASAVEIIEIISVEIIEVSSEVVTGEDIREISFTTLVLKAEAGGDVPELLVFFSRLSERFPTSVDDSIDINVEEQSATFTLRIHTYEGD